MSLADYSTSELMSEIRSRDKHLNKMREDHYENNCKKCISNCYGMCAEVGGPCHNITSCVFFRKSQYYR